MRQCLVEHTAQCTTEQIVDASDTRTAVQVPKATPLNAYRAVPVQTGSTRINCSPCVMLCKESIVAEDCAIGAQ
eukprot:2392753-Amphidinium_carterae.1